MENGDRLLLLEFLFVFGGCVIIATYALLKSIKSKISSAKKQRAGIKISNPIEPKYF